MSRLYDKLLAEKGGYLDFAMQGAITNLAPDLQKAQCFLMSKDIMEACAQVCETRPSTVLSAHNLVRTPYTHTWIEWSPAERPGNRNNNKPVPKRVGTLMVTNEACQEGWLVLAWEHNDGSLMVNPLGLCFCWERDGTPAIEKYARGKRIPDAAEIGARKRQWVEGQVRLPDRWHKFENNPEEFKAAIQLEMTAAVIPLDACLAHLEFLRVLPGTRRYDSLVDDLSGELPFIEAFLLLLNSRNSVIEQQREDFTRLNRARLKNRKLPLKEFVTTRIRLSRVQGNRATAAGMTREAMRLHLVRGHFKIRAGGVFWWSPHTRGKGETVTRADYKVT